MERVMPRVSHTSLRSSVPMSWYTPCREMQVMCHIGLCIVRATACSVSVVHFLLLLQASGLGRWGGVPGGKVNAGINVYITPLIDFSPITPLNDITLRHKP